MALNAAIVWETRTTATAANANGGGFKTGATGTDFSQQDAAQYSLTGVTTAGADAVLLSGSAAADMVGNIAYISSGTNFTVGRYEITSVSVGVSITLDRNCASAAGALGVVAIGGALSLGSSDDAIFETMVAGNKMFVKSGTYTLNGTVSISAAGSTTVPIIIEGYASTRGDRPAGSTRPIFDAGAVAFSLGAYWTVFNMQFTGSGANLLVTTSSGRVINTRCTNTSTTANRDAIFLNSSSYAINCEAISYRGIGINTNANSYMIGCYCHDSNVGINSTSNGGAVIINCLIVGNVTYGIRMAAGNAQTIIYGNTIYGSQSKLGVGFSLITGNLWHVAIGNIFYGLTSGVTHADVQSISVDMYNAYFNNTSDVTNWAKGQGALALDPGFANVAEVTGTTATTNAGVLTDAAASFANVTDNQDFIYISAGTGVTAGKYLITAHTATTVTTSPAVATDATADKVYRVTTGANFGVGTNMKNVGFPGAYIGSSTVSYSDVGAIQRAVTTGGASKGGFGKFGSM